MRFANRDLTRLVQFFAVCAQADECVAASQVWAEDAA